MHMHVSGFVDIVSFLGGRKQETDVRKESQSDELFH